MTTGDRVHIKHVGYRYFLVTDPRDTNVGLFYDDWGTIEPYPMNYASAERTVEDIAWEAVDDYQRGDYFNRAFAQDDEWNSLLHAIILAAIEEAQSCEK